MRRKTIFNIILVALLVVAAGFAITSYTKSKARYDNIKAAVTNVNSGDSERDYKVALELYESAVKYLNEPAVELRTLFSKWSEIQSCIFDISRTVRAGEYESFRVEKKLEHFKLLMEEVEKRTEELTASESITPEELWKVNNLMGCIKLYKTLLIQESDYEKRQKQMQGLFNEAFQSFEKAIDVIQENKLTGIQTNIPQWNLEKLLKKQKGKNGDGEEGGDKDKEGEQGKESEKGKEQEEQLKKMIPFFSVGAGDISGWK